MLNFLLNRGSNQLIFEFQYLRSLKSDFNKQQVFVIQQTLLNNLLKTASILLCHPKLAEGSTLYLYQRKDSSLCSE